MSGMDEFINELKRLYAQYGYRKFTPTHFESYELYARNRDFLKSGHIISFTDFNGRLLALRPDVTLSIVRHSRGGEEKLYYHEQVYREERRSYREIPQMGVEFLGRVDVCAEAELLTLAVRSLACLSAPYCLRISHMAFLNLILDTMQPDVGTRARILDCLACKNASGVDELAAEGAIGLSNAATLKSLMLLYAPLAEGLTALKPFSPNKEGDRILAQLFQLCEALSLLGLSERVYLDFSIVNSMDYYQGLIFQGMLEGVPEYVLSGGRYDRLAEKMGKNLGAIGFALYLDRIEAYLPRRQEARGLVYLIYEQSCPLPQLLAYAESRRQEGEQLCCISEESWQSRQARGQQPSASKLLWMDSCGRLRASETVPPETAAAGNAATEDAAPGNTAAENAVPETSAMESAEPGAAAAEDAVSETALTEMQNAATERNGEVRIC